MLLIPKPTNKQTYSITEFKKKIPKNVKKKMATLHYGNIIKKKYLNLKNNEIQSNIQDTTYKNPKNIT